MENISQEENQTAEVESEFVQVQRKCGLAATAEEWQANPELYVDDCLYCELATAECL